MEAPTPGFILQTTTKIGFIAKSRGFASLVSGSTELAEALDALFSDTDALEARRAAAKQAAHVLSNGIVERVWNLIDLHVVRKAISPDIGKSPQWDTSYLERHVVGIP
ncbi:hypothetical protein Scep_005344 [Stephania cephalantha]|uniref:Uncharacterized protein n=1 Tax=Stephania cephalantha TaxID=152367 RepID=A0AAP0PXE5_9MAGN